MCDDVQLCNRCVCEFLILACTWFTFGLPSKTECDKPIQWHVQVSKDKSCLMLTSNTREKSRVSTNSCDLTNLSTLQSTYNQCFVPRSDK
jgi:hypothetical protein